MTRRTCTALCGCATAAILFLLPLGFGQFMGAPASAPSSDVRRDARRQPARDDDHRAPDQTIVRHAVDTSAARMPDEPGRPADADTSPYAVVRLECTAFMARTIRSMHIDTLAVTVGERRAFGWVSAPVNTPVSTASRSVRFELTTDLEQPLDTTPLQASVRSANNREHYLGHADLHRVGDEQPARFEGTVSIDEDSWVSGRLVFDEGVPAPYTRVTVRDADRRKRRVTSDHEGRFMTPTGGNQVTFIAGVDQVIGRALPGSHGVRIELPQQNWFRFRLVDTDGNAVERARVSPITPIHDLGAARADGRFIPFWPSGMVTLAWRSSRIVGGSRWTAVTPDFESHEVVFPEALETGAPAIDVTMGPALRCGSVEVICRTPRPKWSVRLRESAPPPDSLSRTRSAFLDETGRRLLLRDVVCGRYSWTISRFDQPEITGTVVVEADRTARIEVP